MANAVAMMLFAIQCFVRRYQAQKAMHTAAFTPSRYVTSVGSNLIEAVVVHRKMRVTGQTECMKRRKEGGKGKATNQAKRTGF